MLPSILGIGFQKCGTTSFFDFLNTSQHIYTPNLRKEIHFFDDLYNQKTLSWYSQLYDTKIYEHTLDFTPKYSLHPAYAARIKYVYDLKNSTYPKLLTIVRSPWRRLYSQYRMHLLQISDISPTEFILSSVDALTRSMYAMQLLPFEYLFGSENIHIVVYERLFSDDTSERMLEVSKLSRFLKIDSSSFVQNQLDTNNSSHLSASSIRYKSIYRALKQSRKLLLKHDLLENSWIKNSLINVFRPSNKAIPLISFQEFCFTIRQLGLDSMLSLQLHLLDTKYKLNLPTTLYISQ